VQITLDNILDLIKLYFYFNNVNLKNNNIRKCVVELRKNVSGNYKGYVFSDSLQEAKEIKEILKNELQNEKINFRTKLRLNADVQNIMMSLNYIKILIKMFQHIIYKKELG
jgi:isocitrate dehydrogenase